MCFGGQERRDERKIGLKGSLFSSSDMLMTDPAQMAPHKVAACSTLIGLFEPNQVLTTQPSTTGKCTFCRKSSIALGLPRAIF